MEFSDALDTNLKAESNWKQTLKRTIKDHDFLEQWTYVARDSENLLGNSKKGRWTRLENIF